MVKYFEDLWIREKLYGLRLGFLVLVDHLSPATVRLLNRVVHGHQHGERLANAARSPVDADLGSEVHQGSVYQLLLAK